MKAVFLDPEKGGKKSNKQGKQSVGKKNNTNGLFGLGLSSAFPSLVDDNGNDNGTVHVQEEMWGSIVNAIVVSSEPVLNSSSYAHKLSPTSLTKANLRKINVDVPNDVDYHILLPLDSVHEVSDRMKNSLYGYFIGKRLAFPVVESFIDGLSLIASKIGTRMMLDSYMNTICLESWSRSSSARILIEIDACNVFCDNMIMVGPNEEGPGYTKETIRRTSSEADDDGFIEVKKKKPGGKGGVSPKTAPPGGNKNVATSGNSLKTASKTNDSPSGNRIVSLSNSFDALNDDNSVTMEVESGRKILCLKVDSLGDHGSDEEVEYVDNEMASYLASNTSGARFQTKSLLEQWNDSYGDVDYDYDPYDNDLYEGQEILENFQAICDNLNIKVRGQNKK
ncbi:hypothetical protein Tco_0209280 [Tanacetum coccineum]